MQLLLSPTPFVWFAIDPVGLRLYIQQMAWRSERIHVIYVRDREQIKGRWPADTGPLVTGQGYERGDEYFFYEQTNIKLELSVEICRNIAWSTRVLIFTNGDGKEGRDEKERGIDISI